MNLANQAFLKLFPEKNISSYNLTLTYNDKFKPYNANVKYSKSLLKSTKIQFNLSKKWKSVDKEIQIGLIQELMLKVFKKKETTTNIELYNIFMKNIHIAAPKTKSDPILEDSFNRVNKIFFYNSIEKPNLAWGKKTIRKLGTYEYGSDTITISSIFENEKEILDYVMYHEMLHKKHKFKNKNGRNYHHTKEFRAEENSYPFAEEIEKKISSLVRKKRIKKAFFQKF